MLELVLDNSPDDAGPFVFTVFTPTFNRALTLHRVYQCLEGQTFRDFEWLIVDDGSSDSTGDLVAMWAKTASFPVRYWRQENLGKHVAFNRGVERANGAFFLTLDSDDWCVPEALARLKSHWDSIPEKVRDDFSAVTVLCKTEEGEIVGEPFPNEFVDSNCAIATSIWRNIGASTGPMCSGSFSFRRIQRSSSFLKASRGEPLLDSTKPVMSTIRFAFTPPTVQDGSLTPRPEPWPPARRSTTARSSMTI